MGYEFKIEETTVVIDTRPAQDDACDTQKAKKVAQWKQEFNRHKIYKR